MLINIKYITASTDSSTLEAFHAKIPFLSYLILH